MYYGQGPRKRHQYSPTEKKNIVKFVVFCVVMVLCGMAFGWFLLHLMSYR